MNNGWRIVPLLHRKPGQAEYVDRMVKEIKALNIPKKPVSTVQSASLAPLWDSENNKLRDMTEQEILAYQNRPMPEKEAWRRDADAEKINAELMLVNPSRIQSTIAVQDIRRKSKNTIGDAVSEGGSGFTPERKELARQAFSFTPPVQLTEQQKSKLTELNKITEYTGPAPEEKPKKKKWFEFLLGNKPYTVVGTNKDEV
jgi:hypothetical protein